MGEPLEKVVKFCLGNKAIVGGAVASTKEHLMKDFQDGLNFRGDAGAHPSLKYLDSQKCKDHFDSVISEVDSILKQSDLVLSFWLKSGHPFYPVFWDFAYLIELPEDSIIFIASSSD